MGFYFHLGQFAGRRVVDFPVPSNVASPPGPTDTGSFAWHLSDWSEEGRRHEEFPEMLEIFLDEVPSDAVEALVIGQWAEWLEGQDCMVVEDLVAVADRLPALRALFVNDLVDSQLHVSWTWLPRFGPLLEAFPNLAELWIRGVAQNSTEPLIPPMKHAGLRTLVFQSGGLNAPTVRALAECEFPELTHLEIYLGDPNYGGDATIDDLAPFLDARRFPQLRYLGLKDSLFQDEIAAAVAHAPIVAQLETLDLSLGTLGDEGAAALLAGQPLGHLRKLDLSHHYMSADMQTRLRTAWPGVEVDVSDEEDVEDTWDERYIAVAE